MQEVNKKGLKVNCKFFPLYELLEDLHECSGCFYNSACSFIRKHPSPHKVRLEGSASVPNFPSLTEL